MMIDFFGTTPGLLSLAASALVRSWFRWFGAWAKARRAAPAPRQRPVRRPGPAGGGRGRRVKPAAAVAVAAVAADGAGGRARRPGRGLDAGRGLARPWLEQAARPEESGGYK